LFGNATIDQSVDEYCNLNIFEMIANTNEPTKKLVSRTFDFYKVLDGYKKY
jgi:hypothetical protein